MPNLPGSFVSPSIKNITQQDFWNFSYKESCRLATTGALTLASDFYTGSTHDGFTLVVNDRILIKDQLDASENGIYTVNNSDPPTRAVDFNNPSEVTKGSYVAVSKGTINANTAYVLSTDASPGADTVIDTTLLSFTNVATINIAGQTEMTGDVADADELLISDAGTVKRADFSVVRDAVFTDVSGDAAIADGGALTIEPDAVTYAKMQNLVTGNRVLGAATSGVIGEVQIATNMIATSAVDLTSKVTGSLPVANGGTGGNSKSTAATGLGLGTTDDVQFDSLGIGMAASSTAGQIDAQGDIIAYSSSDKRLKTNITKIENPLDKLDKINGYMFDWIEKEGIHTHEGHDTGVIAQEIEEIIPEITTTRDNGYKAVKYEKIVPLLIESIKEQQQQIDLLREEINLLKK